MKILILFIFIIISNACFPQFETYRIVVKDKKTETLHIKDVKNNYILIVSEKYGLGFEELNSILNSLDKDLNEVRHEEFNINFDEGVKIYFSPSILVCDNYNYCGKTLHFENRPLAKEYIKSIIKIVKSKNYNTTEYIKNNSTCKIKH